ncbi:hypothetical protein GCM10009849_36010 [Sinomonas flava]|uniref:Uncharacterized protein n=1 Tax=Sinomonas flava TaxID=496857 RepID=A0ABP5NVJ4_9MICC
MSATLLTRAPRQRPLAWAPGSGGSSWRGWRLVPAAAESYAVAWRACSSSWTSALARLLGPIQTATIVMIAWLIM